MPCCSSPPSSLLPSSRLGHTRAPPALHSRRHRCQPLTDAHPSLHNPCPASQALFSLPQAQFMTPLRQNILSRSSLLKNRAYFPSDIRNTTSPGNKILWEHRWALSGGGRKRAGGSVGACTGLSVCVCRVFSVHLALVPVTWVSVFSYPSAPSCVDPAGPVFCTVIPFACAVLFRSSFRTSHHTP